MEEKAGNSDAAEMGYGIARIRETEKRKRWQAAQSASLVSTTACRLIPLSMLDSTYVRRPSTANPRRVRQET